MSKSTDKSAFNKGQAEYQAKRKAGLIKVLNPIEKAAENPRSMRYAINAKCFDCTCFQKREITLCEMTDCPLWQLRPYQKAKVVKEDFEA